MCFLLIFTATAAATATRPETAPDDHHPRARRPGPPPGPAAGDEGWASSPGKHAPSNGPTGTLLCPPGGQYVWWTEHGFLVNNFFFTIFKINFIRTGLSETSWVRKINRMDIESSWSLVSYKENDTGQLHCIVYLYLINMYFDRFWYEIWCRKKNCLILNEVLSFKKRSGSLEIFWSFIGIYYVHLYLYIELSILHGFESSFRLRFVSLSDFSSFIFVLLGTKLHGCTCTYL